MVADTGETSVDDATRRMMKFLISPELAVEYNMLGRHGEKKFRDLRLFNVVYEALKNYLTSKVNLQEAEKALSKWFSGTKDRGGPRAARISWTSFAITFNRSSPRIFFAFGKNTRTLTCLPSCPRTQRNSGLPAFSTTPLDYHRLSLKARFMPITGTIFRGW
ncbi:uncharacterized protein LOC143419117 [Maylandia zebra]|uniref:uncharacterized protein LOC143419117 n=1 Tax=Maylandia zebra TaxID=106582 RepID=UPI00403C8B4B